MIDDIYLARAPSLLTNYFYTASIHRKCAQRKRVKDREIEREREREREELSSE